MRYKLAVIGIILSLFISVPGCQALGKSLEQMGYTKGGKMVQAAGAAGAALAPFSIDEEVEIGRAMAARLIEASGGIYPDEQLNRYVNLVGRTVALNVDRTDLDASMYQFAILNTNEINAFAAPGGYVLVTKGTLRTITNEAELAGVLAHEISHVDKEHLLSAIKAAHGTEFVSQMVSLYNENDNSKLNKLLGSSSEAGLSVLYKKGLSRECEREADENAVKLLARAGYYPGGLEDFLQRIKGQMAQNNSGFKTLTATHPAPETRIKTIENYSAQKHYQASAGQKLADRYTRYVQGVK